MKKQNIILLLVLSNILTFIFAYSFYNSSKDKDEIISKNNLIVAEKQKSNSNLQEKVSSLESDIVNLKSEDNLSRSKKINSKKNELKKPSSSPTKIKTSVKENVKTKTNSQKKNSGVRTGCICRDGTRSYATGRGACSHHGGVAYWLYE